MSALRTMAVAVIVGALMIWAGAAGAIVFEQREFDNDAQRARYKQLVYELRCLVCQNQNIAESDAELAADLRREVHRMILEGSSDQQIVDFMVARYGDFVLYRPPFTARTLLLWVGPFVLGIVGMALLLLHLRRRAAPAGLSDEERRRLQALLNEEKG